MKLFNTNNMEIINTCREEFKFSLPSQQISVRNAKFMESDGAKMTLWDGIVFSCNLQLINKCYSAYCIIIITIIIINIITIIIIINVTRYIYVMKRFPILTQ